MLTDPAQMVVGIIARLGIGLAAGEFLNPTLLLFCSARISSLPEAWRWR
jgi:hypothetical protein